MSSLAFSAGSITDDTPNFSNFVSNTVSYDNAEYDEECEVFLAINSSERIHEVNISPSIISEETKTANLFQLSSFEPQIKTYFNASKICIPTLKVELFNMKQFANIHTYLSEDIYYNIIPENIVLKNFVWNSRKIEFINPIEILVEIEEDLFRIRYPDLNISILEDSRLKALNSFYDEVLFLWEDYASEDNSNLTERAVNLKNRLLNLIKGVS